MSRSRPRVAARCSFHASSTVRNAKRSRCPGRSRCASRRPKSAAISQSVRASPGRRHRRAHARDAPLGVGDRAVLFAPARRGQHDVGVARRLDAGVGVLHDDQLGALERRAHRVLVRQRLRGVRAGDPDRLDPAAAQRFEHLDRGLAGGLGQRIDRPTARRSPRGARDPRASRCPGSRFASPPTSRPPIAFGCPVRLNGPAPGRPIWPVARCRLISAAFLSVPEVDWFSPWQYSDSAAPASPNHRAACTRSRSAMPQIPAAVDGVYSRTVSRSAWKPSVCARMNAWSTSPSHSSRCSMPWNSTTSVPGAMARCRSASRAVSVRRGSTTITRRSVRRARAASRRR